MKNLLSSLSLVLIICSACNTGKQIAGFDEVKKSMDTLVILPVVTDVFKMAPGQPREFNNDLSLNISSHVSRQLHHYLSQKYFIVQDTLQVYKAASLALGFDTLRKELDARENPIDHVGLPSSFQNLAEGYPQRYFLISFLNGRYTVPDPRPATSGTIPVNSLGQMIYGIVLFDRVSGEVIYYREETENGHPMDPKAVKHLVSKTIKNLYYK